MQNINGYDISMLDHHGLSKHKSEGGLQKELQAANSVESKLSMRFSSVEYFSSSVREDGGYKILAQALSIEFSIEERDSRKGVGALSSFQAPSPVDVANKVLGFVEARLNSERDAGADQERINGLIAQAREGMEKGFSQARKDIESLGLMTEQLDLEIGESFQKINNGLDGFKKDFNALDSKVLGDNASSELLGGGQKGALSRAEVAVSASQFSQEEISVNEVSSTASVDVLGRTSFRNDSEFTLTTQDGDTVVIRFAQAGVESFQLQGQSFQYDVSESQSYFIEVKGELDAGELEAISNLLAQVGEVSKLFFEGRFEDAFTSALNVGFDASEIASFALDLSQVQRQEIRVYDQGYGASTQGGISQNQALIDVVGYFERALAQLERFESLAFDLNDLIASSVMDVLESGEKSSAILESDFMSFSKRLTELLGGEN